MVTYECPRCGYKSHIRTYLKKHFLRKNICTATVKDIPIDQCIKDVFSSRNDDILLLSSFLSSTEDEISSKYPPLSSKYPPFEKISVLDEEENEIHNKKNNQCKYCNKILSNYKNRWRHEQICKIKYSKENEILELQNKIEDMMIEQNKINIQNSNNTNNTNNSNNTNCNNTTNITINKFGNENVDYITKEKIIQMIKGGPYVCFPELLKMIYFNPEHKENSNIIIQNKKQPFVKVYGGNDWSFKDKKKALKYMTDKTYNMTLDAYDDMKYDDPMERFIKNYDNGNLEKLFLSEAELTILNNQEKFHKNIHNL